MAEPESTARRVWGVCVAYNPEAALFAEVVAATKIQAAGLIVVDNGCTAASGESVREICDRASAKLVVLESNRGLAAALNVGASMALREGATDILFLDHDSVPQPGMIAALLAARENLTAGRRIGALGAVAVDARTGRMAPFVRFGMMGRRRMGCGEEERQVVETDMLNTSGTLVPADALAAIGQMDEGLFIDHIDTDWCLRARRAGYALFGVCTARLLHRLGDDVFELGAPFNRSIHLHSPPRFYYFVRNSLLLYVRPHAPLRWVVPDAVRLLLLVVFYGVVPNRRFEYWSAALRAGRDALAWRPAA